MKITKSINSATNSCGTPAKPSTVVEQTEQHRYLYITKHGLGPGTKPKDAKLLDSKELPAYLTAIWLDRPLTAEELKYYDIYPETEIDDVLEKYDISETSESLSEVMSATYDNSAETINEDYIARLIESVDSKLPDTFVTYKYDVGSNVVTCTSASPKQIAEYVVPIEDLSGIIDEDMEYILGAIDDEYQSIDDDASLLVEDGRYEFVDSKVVLDSDGFTTEYTMYYDTTDDRYVFVFGDSDFYSPYEEYFDFVCDTKQEAQEWFDDYRGPGEEDESDIDYNWYY